MEVSHLRDIVLDAGLGASANAGDDARDDAGDDVVVRTGGLSKWYGDVRGIVDLDLAVRRGEVFGFIGPNGAGKTTTIRLILDLIRPSGGSAEVFGLDSHRDAVSIKERIGYVPADLQLFDRMTGAELFAWLGRLRRRHDPERAIEIARRLALDPDRRIGDLSTGNRQKVGIVQAFMHRPDLLILDEPTSGLDPLVRRNFRDLIHEVVADGATVFLSSHVLSEVEDICDRVAMIVDGRLERIDRIEELREHSRRRIRITVDGAPDLEPLRAVPGVETLRLLHEPKAPADRTSAELEMTGPVDALVKAIGRFPVIDLLSEPVSLEDIFLRSYDRRNDEFDGPIDGPGHTATGKDLADASLADR